MPATPISDQEIFSRLCNYDPRNPLSVDLRDLDDPTPAAAPGCSCDNCFYGRHALASALLADRQTTTRLARLASGALAFIEHSEANRGKATSDPEWDANVAAFRQRGPSSVGIGRSYTDKARVDIEALRGALATYGVLDALGDPVATDAPELA